MCQKCNFFRRIDEPEILESSSEEEDNRMEVSEEEDDEKDEDLSDEEIERRRQMLRQKVLTQKVDKVILAYFNSLVITNLTIFLNKNFSLKE